MKDRDRDDEPDRERDRDRDYDRENGANGEDRKGMHSIRAKHVRSTLTTLQNAMSQHQSMTTSTLPSRARRRRSHYGSRLKPPTSSMPMH